MLSLSALVKLHDNVLTVVVHEQIFIEPEDAPDPPEITACGGCTIESLLYMARRHFSKRYAVTIGADIYYAQWVDSMQELIYDAGSTESEFLKMLCGNQ